jgi:uncharacterized protein YndB with AHSA1/START domain
MNTEPTVTVVADPQLPAVHFTRDFAATPAQLIRAHTDPEVFAAWVGPADIGTTIDYWDARTGGSWRFLNHRIVNHRDSNKRDTNRRDTNHGSEGETREEYGFHGCFHEVSATKLVQTFTFEGAPDSVSLDTLTVTDLGNGRTRLSGTSLCGSFAERDAMLHSGMESGMKDGYRKLDALLAAGGL